MTSKQFLVSLFIVFIVGMPAYAGLLEKLTTPVMGDLNGVSWHPTDNYAVVVGEGVYKLIDTGSGYDFQALPTYPPTLLVGVDWRPQGDIALMISQEGYIYTFDGTDVVELPYSVIAPLLDVAFSPTGDVGLISGYGGILLAYEDGTITDYSQAPTFMMAGIAWHPSGDFAWIVGTEDSKEKIVRWEDGIVSEEWHDVGGAPESMDFHPSGDYALIAEGWGHVSRYDDLSGYQPVETSFELEAHCLQSVKWNPGGDMALIVGAWSYPPMPHQQFCAEFDGERFNVLRLSYETPEPYEDAAWNPDGSAAVVVGESGEILIYDPIEKVMGDICCDKNNYHSGETMSLLVDLMNYGFYTKVDVYISVSIMGGMNLYWPTFSLTPVRMPANLKAGFN
ncbi:MAG: WD40 repeat domain-containing protein, partial [Planctomycetota bacterium]